MQPRRPDVVIATPQTAARRRRALPPPMSDSRLRTGSAPSPARRGDGAPRRSVTAGRVLRAVPARANRADVGGTGCGRETRPGRRAARGACARAPARARVFHRRERWERETMDLQRRYLGHAVRLRQRKRLAYGTWWPLARKARILSAWRTTCADCARLWRRGTPWNTSKGAAEWQRCTARMTAN